MVQDIYFYNFQWKDYSPCDEHSLLDIVKVMAFALTEGKVSLNQLQEQSFLSFHSSFSSFHSSFSLPTTSE